MAIIKKDYHHIYNKMRKKYNKQGKKTHLRFRYREYSIKKKQKFSLHKKLTISENKNRKNFAALLRLKD